MMYLNEDACFVQSKTHAYVFDNFNNKVIDTMNK